MLKVLYSRAIVWIIYCDIFPTGIRFNTNHNNFRYFCIMCVLLRTPNLVRVTKREREGAKTHFDILQESSSLLHGSSLQTISRI